MSIAQSLLPEYDQEMSGTRKTLERCPDDQWDWKPHEKSGTLGWLAGHVATLPEWTTMTLRTEQFDYAPVGGSTYQPPKISNRKELLDWRFWEADTRSEEHTSELQSRFDLVCRLLLEKK